MSLGTVVIVSKITADTKNIKIFSLGTVNNILCFVSSN